MEFLKFKDSIELNRNDSIWYNQHLLLKYFLSKVLCYFLVNL